VIGKRAALVLLGGCVLATGCAPPAPAHSAVPLRVPPSALRVSGDARKPGESPVQNTATAVAPPMGAPLAAGEATYYGDKFRGKKTASGEPFDPDARTAAHRTLPFGTYVEVRRLDTGRSIVVRINDRGPFGRGNRIIDLSQGAAAALDMLREGVVAVELRVVSGPQ
jgi:rare lipoprotein A